jgi:dihydrofolate synthase/folylpolyglutamate synthase
LSAPGSQRRARFGTLEQWLDWLETLHPKKIDLGLERIGAVLRTLELDRPPYAIVTVGGTNGKGSCVALLESIYQRAGYTVGAFTSPHLWRFNERIRCNGRPAEDAELIELFELIEDRRGEISLSYFETSAVAALLYFARREVAVAILEVGLGGRLDAVNAVDADVALIVSIDIDHSHWLGSNRDAIGYEKAGVVRADKPAVVADPDPPAGLLGEIARRGARLQQIGHDYGALREGQGWRYWGQVPIERALPLPRFGTDEQLLNSAACVAVVQALGARLPVTVDAMAAGLESAVLRGRCERHLVGGAEWIFDIAHNPAAARVLAAALRAMPAAPRCIAVVGIMRDKDIVGVLTPLVPEIDAWFVAPVESERGASAAEISAALRALGVVDGVVCDDVASACAAVRMQLRTGDRVVVFGSFYVVGPALAALGLYSPPSSRDD